MDPDRFPNLDGACNCLAARRASRYLTAAYDAALSPIDLRITQFSILLKLTRLGPLAIGELAEMMSMDRTTLATNLKPLQRDSLIAMAPGEDRRIKKAQITPSGLLKLQSAIPLWQEVQTKFEASYGDKKALALRVALQGVLQSGFSPWSEAPRSATAELSERR